MNSTITPKNSNSAHNYFLLTNIDIIDIQHKKIFELFDRLQDLKIDTIDFKAVLTVLAEFDECMNSHFETEENLMRTVGASDIEKHVQQHNFFRNKFREFRETSETKNLFLKNLNYELSITFLRNWLFTHFKNFDSLYLEPVQRYIDITGNKIQ